MVAATQLDLNSIVYFVAKKNGQYSIMESKIESIIISTHGTSYTTKIGKVVKSNYNVFQKGSKVAPITFRESQLDSCLYDEGIWPVFSCKDNAKEYLYA